MSTCFERTFDAHRLDREPFVFAHRMLGHSALSLENLARVVAELPEDQVFASSGLSDLNANFDRAHIDHGTGLSLARTMETLRTSNHYLMVRKPETHPSFRSLFAELKHEVEQLMRDAGRGQRAHDAMLYLFIASPNSITPFHIDRYSTFLMQFQGEKTLVVYPAWDASLVTPEVAESFVSRSGARPKHDPSLDHLGRSFLFAPGQTLHIPFLSPHHVKNGPGDVSISLSIIFNTDETWRQIEAMRFNDAVRRKLGRFGVRARPVGRSELLDRTKALALRSAIRLRDLSR